MLNLWGSLFEIGMSGILLSLLVHSLMDTGNTDRRSHVEATDGDRLEDTVVTPKLPTFPADYDFDSLWLGGVLFGFPDSLFAYLCFPASCLTVCLFMNLCPGICMNDLETLPDNYD